MRGLLPVVLCLGLMPFSPRLASAPSWFLSWYSQLTSSTVFFSPSGVQIFFFSLGLEFFVYSVHMLHSLHPTIDQSPPLGISLCPDKLSSFKRFTSPSYSDTSVVVQIHTCGCCFQVIQTCRCHMHIVLNLKYTCQF